jgi:beta-N-acetylhexosaminidase
MNMREKIGSLFMIGFDGTEPPDTLRELIQDYFVGGVILFSRNIKSKEQLKKLISEIKAIAAPRPLLIAIDHEGGRVFRMPEKFSKFVPMAKIGAIYKKTQNSTPAYNIGKIMANELKEVGINVNFAPVLDVNTNPKNPVIGDRSFSDNANECAALGVQLVKGLQENGIVACGKHFPGHGDTSLDSHFELPETDHTLGRLQSIELVPFAAAIEAGVRSLMTAHIIYKVFDSKMPATLSPAIISDLLRLKLGFKGVVFTDDLQMKAITKLMPIGEASVLALRAGCDICLIASDSTCQKEAIDCCISAVASGRLHESIIETSSRRIQTLYSYLRQFLKQIIVLPQNACI